MFSILNRIRACVLLRALVVLLVAVFVCVSIVPSVMARAPKPHEDAGDGEGIGGYRDAEDVEPLSGEGADESATVSPWTEAPNMHYVDSYIMNWYWFIVLMKRI